MNTIAFDTLAYVKKLKAAGEKEEIAEAHVEAMRELMLDEIATKGDIDLLHKDMALLRKDMEAMENRMVIKLGGMMVVAIGVTAIIIRILDKI